MQRFEWGNDMDEINVLYTRIGNSERTCMMKHQQFVREKTLGNKICPELRHTLDIPIEQNQEFMLDIKGLAMMNIYKVFAQGAFSMVVIFSLGLMLKAVVACTLSDNIIVSHEFSNDFPNTAKDLVVQSGIVAPPARRDHFRDIRDHACFGADAFGHATIPAINFPGLVPDANVAKKN